MRWEMIFVTFAVAIMATLGWVLRGRPRHEQIIGWAMMITVMLGFAMAYLVLALTNMLS